VRWLPKDQDNYEWLATAIMVPLVVVVLALVPGLAGLAAIVVATVLLAIGLLRARKPLARWLRSHVGHRTA
jgi:hypothetical protein